MAEDDPSGKGALRAEEIEVSGKISVFNSGFPETCRQCDRAFETNDIVVDFGAEYGRWCTNHIAPQDGLYDEFETLPDFVKHYVQCRWVQVPLELPEDQLDEWLSLFATMLASFDPRTNLQSDDGSSEIQLWDIIPLIRPVLHDGGVLSSFGPESPYRVQVMPLALEIEKQLVCKLWKPFISNEHFKPNCVMKMAATSFGRWIVRYENELGPCVLRQHYGNDKALRNRRAEKDPEKAGKMSRAGTESIQSLLAFADTRVRVTVVGRNGKGGIEELLPAGKVLIWDSDYEVEIIGSCVGYWSGIHSCSHTEKVYGMDSLYHDVRIDFALGKPPIEKNTCHFKAYGYKMPKPLAFSLKPVLTVEHPMLYPIQDRQDLLAKYDEVLRSFPCYRQQPVACKRPISFENHPLLLRQDSEQNNPNPLSSPFASSDYVVPDDDDRDTVSSMDDDGDAAVGLSEFFRAPEKMSEPVDTEPVKNEKMSSVKPEEKESSSQPKEDDNDSQAMCEDDDEEEEENEESSIDTSVPPELAAQARAFRKTGPLVLAGDIIASSDSQTAGLVKLAKFLTKQLKRYERGSDKVNVPLLVQGLTRFNKTVDDIRNATVLPEGRKRKREAPTRFEEEHSVSLERELENEEDVVDALQEALDVVYNAHEKLCEKHPKIKKLYDRISVMIEQAVDKPEDEKLLKRIFDKIKDLQATIDDLSPDDVMDLSSIEDDDDDDDEADLDNLDESSSSEYGYVDTAEINMYRSAIAETRQMVPYMHMLDEQERQTVVSKLARILVKKDPKYVDELAKINKRIAKRKRDDGGTPLAAGTPKKSRLVDGFVVQMFDVRTNEWRDMMPINGVTVAPIYLDRANAEEHAKAVRQDILTQVSGAQEVDVSKMVRVHTVTR